MGSLSVAKAGVGSAVNDTTRELGGTLGVAVVGSVFASVYSAEIAGNSALSQLPADARSAMGSSVAAARQVVAQLPEGMAAGVRDVVDHAFLDGLRVGSLVCAGIALAAAAVVAVLLPARGSQAGQPVPDVPARVGAELGPTAFPV